PQLNRWIYGYHQAQFLQAIRGGSYRPMVFMRHGLNVAFFMAMAILAATALGKSRVFRVRGRYVALYLFGVLVLCHSLGALIYSAVAAPLVMFTKPRTQVRVAAVLALLTIAYPVSRAMGLIPVERINEFVLEKFGADRAGSLGLRLSEEEWLM